MTVKVVIQDDHHLSITPKPEQFQHWLNATLEFVHEQIPEHICEVCIRIVNAQESATLNKNFRGKEGPTNVLSFSDDWDPEEESLGDLAICADIVAREAEQLGITMNDHWAHLTVHGILHLLDYDHINEEEAEVMEDLEIQILNSLNITNPYEAPNHD